MLIHNWYTLNVELSQMKSILKLNSWWMFKMQMNNLSNALKTNLMRFQDMIDSWSRKSDHKYYVLWEI